jgi:hypothetical protein
MSASSSMTWNSRPLGRENSIYQSSTTQIITCVSKSPLLFPEEGFLLIHNKL